MEAILKGLLLFKNYNHYQSRLRGIGHNLKMLVSVVSKEFKLKKPMSKALAADIETLNSLYSTHRLRYGTIYDLFVDPNTIPYRPILKRIAAVIRLADPVVKKGAGE